MNEFQVMEATLQRKGVELPYSVAAEMLADLWEAGYDVIERDLELLAPDYRSALARRWHQEDA